MPMIPPASCRRVLRQSHTKSPMKNSSGRNDSRSATRLERRADAGHGDVVGLQASEASCGSLRASGIWEV